MSEYTIQIACDRSHPRHVMTLAHWDPSYPNEWNLPGTPATQLLDGDRLFTDAKTGFVTEDLDHESLRLKYHLACPRCNGYGPTVTSERLAAVLNELRLEGRSRITLDKLDAMI